MRKVLIGISVLMLINAVFLFARSGVSNSFIMNAGVLAAVVGYVLFYECLIKQKWLTYLIIAVMVGYAGFGIFLMGYGRMDTATFDEDVAIVLGAGLQGDDVGANLQRRLDRAVAYHFRNPDALIVVSGGLGQGQVVTEAYVMARYLQAHGVPGDRILQENGSHSTYQNMRLSVQVLEEYLGDKVAGDLSMVVITNDFHIFRGVRFGRIAGFGQVSALHGDTPVLNLPGMLVREVAAVVKMWVVGT